MKLESKRLTTFSILLGLAFGGWAAVPAAAQEADSDTVFDVTEVNVVNIEVVVTDSRGRQIQGLTREDFVLLEDGEPVEISNFYAVEDGTAVAVSLDQPAAVETVSGAEVEKIAPIVRPIHLVIYVDTANVSKVNRGKVLARVREFLLEHWREGMRVMLVSNDGPAAGAAVIYQGFTSVPHDLFVGLDQISKQALAGPRLDQDRRLLRSDLAAIQTNTRRGLSTDPEPQTYEQEVQSEVQFLAQRIAVYSEQALVTVRQTVATLTRFVDSMAGMPGRKSILYVSDGLDVTPGADLFEALRSYQSTVALGAAFSSQADTDRRNATRELDKLIARANDHRVTLNILDATPTAMSVDGLAEFDRASGTTTGTFNIPSKSIVERNRLEPLLAIALETGGRAGIGLSAVAKTLDGILTDFDNHYSLGYAADRVDESRSRDIKVAVRGRDDLRVRHRSSVRDKTLVEQAAERARAALLIDDFSGAGLDDNPLDVALVRRDLEPGEDGDFVVTMLVTIPIGSLVLLPSEGLHQAQVSMFVAVRDEKGRTSGVEHHQCPIRIPSADVEAARGQRAACGLRLLMREGPQRVAVSVLDAAAAFHSTVRIDLDIGADSETAANRSEEVTTR